MDKWREPASADRRYWPETDMTIARVMATFVAPGGAGLSCLAPDIVTAIVEGRQPAKLTAKSLSTIDLPMRWREQRAALGF